MKNMAKRLFMAAMCLSLTVTTVPAVNNLTAETVKAADTSFTGYTDKNEQSQVEMKNGLYHEGNVCNYYENGQIAKKLHL